ncbi:hypothetical protein NEA10_04650 [Phormidium yuhuli AB48]|uniref:Uncharacterized protein n=1 Tax=Phormidium yuhuli AB48 TaxID=2940671 RepID=A0ABY5AT46_9CYAN|nr:hypothetical protein [Phormidium yuhuli]USR92018.1 hypothetical protein NEA10_04650 [Phormidium yuhuli AB48]
MATVSNSSTLKPLSDLKLSVYQADHQVKYLHLHAQLDTLMIEIETRRKQGSVPQPPQP